MPKTQPTIPSALAADLERFDHVLGLDEAGLGAWAGPAVVCAAVLRKGEAIPGVTDSKKMSAKAREKVYPRLVREVTHKVVEVGPEVIDKVGLSEAWRIANETAMAGALEVHKKLNPDDDPLAIVDGNKPIKGAVCLPKADLLIPAVSVASVIAKVYRDAVMHRMHQQYPHWGFRSNVGYGTRNHQVALAEHGVCDIHRMSYQPMKDMVKKQDEPSLEDLLESLDNI